LKKEERRKQRGDDFMGGLRKVIVEYLKHMNTVSVPILALPLQLRYSEGPYQIFIRGKVTEPIYESNGIMFEIAYVNENGDFVLRYEVEKEGEDE
jgi:hypothetical protein